MEIIAYLKDNSFLISALKSTVTLFSPDPHQPRPNREYSLRTHIYSIVVSGGIARFTRVLFELPCYPQFELEISIVEVSYFTNILSYLVSSGQLYLKLHILFGYCVDENGVSFPWSTNQQPLFSFMHGRSSHLLPHIISPPVILYTWIRMYIVCFIGFDCFPL